MRLLRALAVLALALLMGGDLRREEIKPVTTKGTITLDGAPVEKATVVLIPLDEDGEPAIGRADKDGKFRLTTFKQGDGALPGEYDIIIIKKVRGKVSEIPAVYGNAFQTPLRCKVPADGGLILDLRKGR